MHDEVIRDLIRRVNALERTRPRLRLGEVTDVNPLDVALGGSGTSYEDVQSAGRVDTGDLVAALVAGNDLLVLGPVGDGAPVHYIGSGDGVAPGFTNSWVNLDNSLGTPGGGTDRDAGFYLDRGRVYLTGVIKTGAASSSAFTLPVGYRPKNTVETAVSAATNLAIVAVQAGGSVIPANRGTSAVSTACYLDGVSFPVA